MSNANSMDVKISGILSIKPVLDIVMVYRKDLRSRIALEIILDLIFNMYGTSQH